VNAIARQEKRFTAADCGSSYAKATEDRARAVVKTLAEMLTYWHEEI